MGPTTTPSPYPRNMPDLVTRAWTEFADKVILKESDGHGGWRGITGTDALIKVRLVAKGLIAAGVKQGERVGIMSRTRLEWTLLDFGLVFAGAVPVPIYDTSSEEQADWITSDANIRLVFVETHPNLALMNSVAKGESPVVDVRCIDDGALEDLAKSGGKVTDAELEKRANSAKPDDLATIIYTSGTTGRPKGVELTHFNFCRHAVGIRRELAVVLENGSVLQFMTLAHVFARIIQVACVYAGTEIGYTPDSLKLVDDMGTFHPTLLVSVPRVFEKVYNGAEQKATASGKLKIFRWAAKQAIEYSQALDTPDGPSSALKFRHGVADRLVLKKIRHVMGGRAIWAVSGGAPLGERLSHFYRGMGLTVLEGYGLTETTAASHVNRPDRLKIGTVGPPLPGVEVKVAADGEILMRGDIVTPGYYRNPEATKEAFTGGWFHSGDIGVEDEEKFLKITGRKKELIVTAGGKNVAPAVLEDRLRGHPLVSQVVAVGDGKPFIGALVTLDPDALAGWLKARNLPPMTIEEASTNSIIKEHLDKAVERANLAVSRAESIRKYRVLLIDFTILNGYLTPSMKVKRSRVLQDFADEIEALYVDTRATTTTS
jgi:long-chain acyl-CoA synthetase